MAWAPIVGKGFTQKGFLDYLDTVDFKNIKKTWIPDGKTAPSFVVIHNTSIPTLKDWHKHPGEVRMHGLANFYKNEQGWQAGPHLFIADDLIWVFTPLTKRGTHTPSWNKYAWGFEMVGEYDDESFTSGPGAKVRDNAVFATAAILNKNDIDPKTIKFHKEDPNTTHDTCPGKNVIKKDFVAAVTTKLAELKSGKIDWSNIPVADAPTATPYAIANAPELVEVAVAEARPERIATRVAPVRAATAAPAGAEAPPTAANFPPPPKAVAAGTSEILPPPVVVDAPSGPSPPLTQVPPAPQEPIKEPQKSTEFFLPTGQKI